MKVIIQFPIKKFIIGTLAPVLTVSILCFSFVCFVAEYCTNSLTRLIYTTIVFLFVYAISVIFIALNSKERSQAVSFLYKKMRKNLKE